jgi:hypothetical protein
MGMKIFFGAYPFVPASGRVLSESQDMRIERYYSKANFEGNSFDIMIELNGAGEMIAFSINNFNYE